MQVDQFRYGPDNLAYVLSSDFKAIAIDPGAVSDIMTCLEEKALELVYVANTHSHPDHVTGTQDILSATEATFLDNHTLRQKEIIKLGKEVIQVYHTPGHTHDSLCFYAAPYEEEAAGYTSPGYLISGDTLFNGTVGNCFSGNFKAFYKSIKSLMTLPKDTIIYAGHDYVQDSIAFAKTLEPDNPYFDDFLKKYDYTHVFSTLEDETKVNPYLRFNAPDLVKLMENKGLSTRTEFERWDAVMHLG
ncbi:Hydroxyacylglutathione hydrolase [Desulfatibacillum aliphaticivorans]|uniref:hydroxyacylglutathione hydrolase n=1 Tax=Desulfatibacillum aliphaticivorans TaxID=218208 RepID=B8FLP2_DESAL|nr:hydroxyacylglutathione hydrolase family protein [Desulfatibacillum aliphaticivorans]ACL05396.1 Hydroxyacylglutathione hydrolase [Desulfatibacillum aliphaticivorans]